MITAYLLMMTLAAKPLGEPRLGFSVQSDCEETGKTLIKIVGESFPERASHMAFTCEKLFIAPPQGEHD